MRRRLMTVLASGVVAVGLVLPVTAQDDHHEHYFCTDAGLPGRAEYGEHIASMAREGHFGADHHPGLHRGYAVCLTDDH